MFFFQSEWEDKFHTSGLQVLRVFFIPRKGDFHLCCNCLLLSHFSPPSTHHMMNVEHQLHYVTSNHSNMLLPLTSPPPPSWWHHCPKTTPTTDTATPQEPPLWATACGVGTDATPKWHEWQWPYKTRCQQNNKMKTNQMQKGPKVCFFFLLSHSILFVTNKPFKYIDDNNDGMTRGNKNTRMAQVNNRRGQ